MAPGNPGSSSEGRQTRQQSKTNSQSDDSVHVTNIKEILESTDFKEFITNTVRSAVREELKELKDSIEKLTVQVDKNESRILTLEIQNDDKTVKIENLEKSLKQQNSLITNLQNKSNDSEQYSRRNCLRLFGVEEKVGESTDDIVMSIAKVKLGVNLNMGDIDRCHRTGPPAKDRNPSHDDPAPGTTPASISASTPASSWAAKVSSSSRKRTAHHRPIIIKFATYRMRQAVLKARRRLKESGLTIVEDLTKTNYDILKKARTSSRVTSVWSQDGRIIAALKTTSGGTAKKVITSMEEAKKLCTES